jgi:hypothetical protein
MSPEDTHNNTQQDESDKTPKYPSPRLMTAAIDRRFFGFLIHRAKANSISSSESQFYFVDKRRVVIVSGRAVEPFRYRPLLQQARAAADALRY